MALFRHRTKEGWGSFRKSPPVFLSSISVVIHARGLHSFLDNRHKLGPFPRLGLAHFAEVNYVPMVSVIRTRVDLFATYKRKDSFSITRVVLDQPSHFAEGRGNV